MYKMVYMGGYNPRIFEEILKFKQINLEGVIIDYTLKSEDIIETKQVMAEHYIPELNLDDIVKVNPDIVFLCDYTKILKSDYIDKYLFLNIHAGILPKWRGFNANCWAMLNGEQQIGYTIHRVSEGLDAGEIFKTIKIKLDENETYVSGRERIKDLLCTSLETIFVEIIERKIEPVIQDENDIVYNCKLKNTDGDIVDWNRPSVWINGLIRVFGIPPHGTGVRIFIKGKVYTVVDMEIAKEIGVSRGIPGAVINKYNDGAALIKTQDTAVRIKMLKDSEGNNVLPGNVLKIGMRL